MSTELINPDGLYGTECIREDKRRNNDGTRTHEISRLWQRSHEIVNLSVKGFNNKEIAEILRIDPQTVSNTLNSELGMRKVADLRQARDEEVKKDQEKIRLLKNKAIEVYNEVLDNEKGEATLKEKLQVADTVMTKFTGLVEPIKVQATHVTLTAADIEELKRRAIESGTVIDSDAKVIEDDTEAEAI